VLIVVVVVVVVVVAVVAVVVVVIVVVIVVVFGVIVVEVGVHLIGVVVDGNGVVDLLMLAGLVDIDFGDLKEQKEGVVVLSNAYDSEKDTCDETL